VFRQTTAIGRTLWSIVGPCSSVQQCQPSRPAPLSSRPAGIHEWASRDRQGGRGHLDPKTSAARGELYVDRLSPSLKERAFRDDLANGPNRPIVLKNPGIGLCPKIGFVAALAGPGAKRVRGEATKPARRQLLPQAGPPPRQNFSGRLSGLANRDRSEKWTTLSRPSSSGLGTGGKREKAGFGSGRQLRQDPPLERNPRTRSSDP
jgi:hypothetical protein